MSRSLEIWSAVLALGLVLLAVGLVLLRRAAATSTRPAEGGAPASPALAVLDDRLARGEIDADEYERRRAVLDEP